MFSKNYFCHWKSTRYHKTMICNLNQSSSFTFFLHVLFCTNLSEKYWILELKNLKPTNLMSSTSFQTKNEIIHTSVLRYKLYFNSTITRTHSYHHSKSTYWRNIWLSLFFTCTDILLGFSYFIRILFNRSIIILQRWKYYNVLIIV
jgi:hypothetical protein